MHLPIHPIDPLCITTILTQEGCTITTIHPIDPLCTTTILTQEELQQYINEKYRYYYNTRFWIIGKTLNINSIAIYNSKREKLQS